MSSKARVAIAPTGAVHVYVSAETLYDLPAIQTLTGTVLGRLGCPGCHSGRQIFFLQEEAEFSVVADKGPPRGPGGTIVDHGGGTPGGSHPGDR
jgi:hypothetical protein